MIGRNGGSTPPARVQLFGPTICGTSMTMDELMQDTFDRSRDPRSIEYKAGCRALLEFKALRRPVKCPYSMGTAQADAFFAGVD